MSYLTINTSDPEAMSGLTTALLSHIGHGDQCSCGKVFDLPLFPQTFDYLPIAQHLRDVLLDALRAKSNSHTVAEGFRQPSSDMQNAEVLVLHPDEHLRVQADDGGAA